MTLLYEATEAAAAKVVRLVSNLPTEAAAQALVALVNAPTVRAKLVEDAYTFVANNRADFDPGVPMAILDVARRLEDFETVDVLRP